MGSGDEVAVPSRGFRRQATGTADDSAARWDLAISIHCAALTVWHELATRREVTAVLDDWLGAHAEVIKAWTFAALPDDATIG